MSGSLENRWGPDSACVGCSLDSVGVFVAYSLVVTSVLARLGRFAAVLLFSCLGKNDVILLFSFVSAPCFAIVNSYRLN
jgi:hypothetical protein